MFESVPQAPPDSILGLAEAFKRDSNPEKINLSVGVYKDPHGNTPVLPSVKEAERRLLEQEASKGYLGIEGLGTYGQVVRELLFGAGDPLLREGRAVTVQTPGGTAAVRLAAEFIAQMTPGKRIWLSQPTWANHKAIFQAAGVEVGWYPYFDPETIGLAWDRLTAAVEQVPAGDFILLHPCCHNPTGVDPSEAQWREFAELVLGRGLHPILDFAYQGFGAGLMEDTVGLRAFLRDDSELLIASSYSKNFGLYNERVGALTAVARQASEAEAVLSQLKRIVRGNYSNPPAHGGSIVATIGRDPALRAQWEGELATMRSRIHGMRRLFAETMAAAQTKRDFSFITRHQGMFSLTGLTPAQVDELRIHHGVYVVGDGRINVAGMTEGNMPRLCECIAAVL